MKLIFKKPGRFLTEGFVSRTYTGSVYNPYEMARGWDIYSSSRHWYGLGTGSSFWTFSVSWTSSTDSSEV